MFFSIKIMLQFSLLQVGMLHSSFSVSLQIFFQGSYSRLRNHEKAGFSIFLFFFFFKFCFHVDAVFFSIYCLSMNKLHLGGTLLVGCLYGKGIGPFSQIFGSLVPSSVATVLLSQCEALSF